MRSILKLKFNIYKLFAISLVIFCLGYWIYIRPCLNKVDDLNSTNAELKIKIRQLNEKINTLNQLKIKLNRLQKKFHINTSWKKNDGIENLVSNIKTSSLVFHSLQNDHSNNDFELIASGRFADLLNFLEKFSTSNPTLTLKRLILKRLAKRHQIEIKILLEKNHY